MIGSSEEFPASLFPLLRPPPLPPPPLVDLLLVDLAGEREERLLALLLPLGERLRDLLLLVSLGSDATRSREINRIVILLGKPLWLPPDPGAAAAPPLEPAEPAAAAPPDEAPPDPLLLRGVLEVLDPDPKLANRLAKLDRWFAALLPGLVLADAALALPPAEAGLLLALLAEPLLALAAESESLIAKGGGGPSPRGMPDVPRLGTLANRTRAVLVGLLPPPPADAAAAPDPLATPAPPGPSSPGKNISITPTIPPP